MPSAKLKDTKSLDKNIEASLKNLMKVNDATEKDIIKAFGMKYPEPSEREI